MLYIYNNKTTEDKYRGILTSANTQINSRRRAASAFCKSSHCSSMDVIDWLWFWWSAVRLGSRRTECRGSLTSVSVQRCSLNYSWLRAVGPWTAGWGFLSLFLSLWEGDLGSNPLTNGLKTNQMSHLPFLSSVLSYLSFHPEPALSFLISPFLSFILHISFLSYTLHCLRLFSTFWFLLLAHAPHFFPFLPPSIHLPFSLSIYSLCPVLCHPTSSAGRACLPLI